MLLGSDGSFALVPRFDDWPVEPTRWDLRRVVRPVVGDGSVRWVRVAVGGQPSRKRGVGARARLHADVVRHPRARRTRVERGLPRDPVVGLPPRRGAPPSDPRRLDGPARGRQRGPRADTSPRVRSFRACSSTAGAHLDATSSTQPPRCRDDASRLRVGGPRLHVGARCVGVGARRLGVGAGRLGVGAGRFGVGAGRLGDGGGQPAAGTGQPDEDPSRVRRNGTCFHAATSHAGPDGARDAAPRVAILLEAASPRCDCARTFEVAHATRVADAYSLRSAPSQRSDGAKPQRSHTAPVVRRIRDADCELSLSSHEPNPSPTRPSVRGS